MGLLMTRGFLSSLVIACGRKTSFLVLTGGRILFYVVITSRLALRHTHTHVMVNDSVKLKLAVAYFI